MKSFKSERFLAVCFCVWIVVHAPSGCCGRNDVLIDKALNLSGLSGQLESLPAAVLSAVPEDAFPDPKTKEEIGSLLKKAAGKDRLLPLVREALLENFNQDMIDQVIGFYDSKLGRKVGRLQGNALAPALMKSVREGRKTTVSMDDARLDLLRRAIKAERVAQYNDTLLHGFIKGLIDGSLGDPGSRDPTNREALEGIEKGIRFDEARAEEIALVAFAHVFRSLDDKELGELVAHKESQAAAWFDISLQKGLNRAAYETGKTLGEAAYTSRRR